MELKVAAYCRVSTDQEDQLGSLESQKTYFARYIAAHEGWTLARVYADEGVSGTGTRRRAAFNEMISDALCGKIDLILTKEVSRFARNTVDTLAYTRRLKERRVGVIFITDNIDTRDNDGEFRLSIMASVAQEESRKTSERVQWGQRRSMERGVVFGGAPPLGYRMNGGALEIDPDGARVVQSIFRKYALEGKGAGVIARELREEGVPTARGGMCWSPSAIIKMIKNEKYCGDLSQRKYITSDYLTHRRVPNPNEADRVSIPDHHEAIISRALWEKAREEMARRTPMKKDGPRYSGRRWCSGRLRCGGCGGPMIPVTRRRGDGSFYRAWACRKPPRERSENCGKCLNESALRTCTRYVVSHLQIDRARLEESLFSRILREQGINGDGAGALSDEKRMSETRKKREKATDLFLGGSISREEWERLKAVYDKEIDRLRARAAAGEKAEKPRGLLREQIRRAVWQDWGEDAGQNEGEELFAALITGVTARPGALDYRIGGLPFSIRVTFETSGTRERYTARVTGCAAARGGDAP